MPRRSDVNSVLVIGPGPIVIGQGAELDCAGTRACRVLKAEGVRVVLVNSNPATIMTDPEFADATYVEPVTPETVEQVIAKERPDALLATFGGRTALDNAVTLHESGVLARYGVELIGADIDAVRACGNREEFKRIVGRVGADVARDATCHTPEQCHAAAAELGYPILVRPSFTTGGSGFAHDERQLSAMVGAGPVSSPARQVLLEESVLGWKEFELELLRDRDDNVVVVCSIENLDPMGVHAGDSITAAPATTLTDQECRRMRDVAIAVVRAVGVDGGCNIRFAIDRRTGRTIVVGANLRMSRSSALAAKATGVPIAEIATKLAVGYTLDEVPDAITGQAPAAFGPSLDHVVVKVPRFASGNFPTADAGLTTRMKSVGEAMAIGRSFPEALNKALRSLDEDGGSLSWAEQPGDKDALVEASRRPTDVRIHTVHQAIRAGAAVEELAAATGIDPWFLDQVRRIEEVARAVAGQDGAIRPETLVLAKRHGLSDAQIGELRGLPEDEVRELRWSLGIRPGYEAVDRCAAEFAALYSSYGEEPAAPPAVAPPAVAPKVVILGSGPNRTGQGAEFDYACVHASFALAAAGYETVMVNCNPQAVSTDPDTSHRLYFEPLTFEDVLEVVAAEQATGEVVGVLVQLGGQTPLGLAARLEAAGVPVVGTSPAGIDLAEDRGAFDALLAEVGLTAPTRGTATSFEQAERIADEIGYPVLVDRFPDNAIEIGVDALYDGRELYLGGVVEHVEEAGAHPGDSACALPPITLGRADIARVRESTRVLADGIGVRGLVNVRYALASGVLHVLKANPRAGRTVPFVSKATGVPLARAAARVMLGSTIDELRAEGLLPPDGDGGTLPPEAAVAVKEAVLPRNRFRTSEGHGVDNSLGPRMRSTGEVMGIGAVFGAAYAKAQAAAGGPLPTKGRAFVSVADRDKRATIFPVKALADVGFEILATAGTAEVLHRHGVDVTVVRAHGDGSGRDDEPTIVSRILTGEVDLVVSTSSGRRDDSEIRTAAVARGVPCVTTVQGLAATVQGIEAVDRGDAVVTSLQEHARLRCPPPADPPSTNSSEAAAEADRGRG
ncbi:carbamoyl-phosphate synthase large subunit [Saccharothrix sp. Mg75]|uniref:carbamoyl-phosphate synthase large subunit n=1 Tax=Saccharothrix sp. Mg75 TaxID=3445357 RepID=UPI003EF072BD